MSYRILGLDPAPFQHLFGLPDEDLSRRGARRCRVDKTPGCPDRIELRDALPGETVLLLNYVHQPAENPYRASHAVFVREGALTKADIVDVVPEVMRIRPISLRAFDGNDEMIDAEVVAGEALEPVIERFLADPAAAYLHAHYARRGCYAARIERA
jgi:hypothetical protein